MLRQIAGADVWFIVVNVDVETRLISHATFIHILEYVPPGTYYGLW